MLRQKSDMSFGISWPSTICSSHTSKVSGEQLYVASDTGPVLTVDWTALQYQGNNISESDSEPAKLHKILGGENQVGAMLNNGNVAKALVAGLPFWGVNLPIIALQMIRPLILKKVATGLSRRSSADQPACQSRGGAGIRTELAEYELGELFAGRPRL